VRGALPRAVYGGAYNAASLRVPFAKIVASRCAATLRIAHQHYPRRRPNGAALPARQRTRINISGRRTWQRTDIKRAGLRALDNVTCDICVKT